jgi:hypothetical protein
MSGPLHVNTPPTEGGGGSAPTPQRVYGVFGKDLLSPAMNTLGYLDIDPSVWPATVGSLVRVLRFVAVVSVDSSGVAMNLRLVKYSGTPTTITNSDILSTAAAETDAERVVSDPLPVGGGAAQLASGQ